MDFSDGQAYGYIWSAHQPRVDSRANNQLSIDRHRRISYPAEPEDWRWSSRSHTSLATGEWSAVMSEITFMRSRT